LFYKKKEKKIQMKKKELSQMEMRKYELFKRKIKKDGSHVNEKTNGTPTG